ncbi:hypothetical protein [Paraburkholderia youngii]|uniref:hypothetical protein n=1 Tax=Paraburkholderia youngii TaxID=2782701 RepID=UPI003D23654B
MSNFAAALSASEYLPQFWLILLHPFIPLMAYLGLRSYRQRNGKPVVGSFWGTTAFVATCAWTPAFAMLALGAASQGEIEAVTQVMDTVRVSRAYDSLCRFSSDHRGPRDIDWATNVLRDHVLWANVAPKHADAMMPRTPLPANEPIPCDRAPFADTSASRERYKDLNLLQSYTFGAFLVTAFGSVWGALFLLLPRKKPLKANDTSTTTTRERAGAA